jgi:hypothetical protein
MNTIPKRFSMVDYSTREPFLFLMVDYSTREPYAKDEVSAA